MQNYDESSKKLIPELPEDVVNHIFSYLGFLDCSRCCLVNKQWNVLAIGQLTTQTPPIHIIISPTYLRLMIHIHGFEKASAIVQFFQLENALLIAHHEAIKKTNYRQIVELVKKPNCRQIVELAKKVVMVAVVLLAMRLILVPL